MTMSVNTTLCLECRQAPSRRRSHRIMCHPVMASRCQGPNNYNRMILKKSSIVFLGLLTCAVVIVQALASSPSNLSPWGTRGGAHVGGKKRSLGSIPYSNLSVHAAVSESDMSSASSSDANNNKQQSENEDQVKADNNIPSPLIQPLNGLYVDNKWKTVDVGSTSITANGAHPPAGKSKKTILTPGGFSDAIIPATYVAETNLPNEFGHYRIRAYRIEEFEDMTREPNPLGAGAGLGSEPCVIYCTDKPPFGGEDGGAKEVPVRIHDQCFTSEVFGSQR